MYRIRLKINIRYLYKNNKLANSTKCGNVKEKHKIKKTSCPTNEDTIINYYYIRRLNHFFHGTSLKIKGLIVSFQKVLI